MKNIESQVGLGTKLSFGVSWSLFARVATIAASFGINILLARLLTPEDVGVFNLARSFVWGASIIITLGLTSAVVKLVAQYQSLNELTKLRATILASLRVCAVSFLVFGVGYKLFLGQWFFESVMRARTLFAYADIILIWVGSFSLLTLLSGFFRGLHDIKLASISEELFFLIATLVVLAGFWLLFGGISLSLSLHTIVYSSWAVAGMFFLLLWRRVRPWPTAKVTVTPEMIDLAWPIFVTNSTIFLLCQADMWILTAYTSSAEVGVYSLAYRLAMIISIFPAVINSAVMPFISSLYAKGEKEKLNAMIRVASIVSFVPALILFLFFVAFGKVFLSFLFGETYADGYFVLIILGAGQLGTAFVCTASFVLSMTGHQKVMMYSAIVTSIFAITLSLVLVETYHSLGVAIGSGLGLFSLQFILWSIVRIRLGIWTHVDLRQIPNILGLTKSLLSGRLK